MINQAITITALADDDVLGTVTPNLPTLDGESKHRLIRIGGPIASLISDYPEEIVSICNLSFTKGFETLRQLVGSRDLITGRALVVGVLRFIDIIKYIFKTVIFIKIGHCEQELSLRERRKVSAAVYWFSIRHRSFTIIGSQKMRARDEVEGSGFGVMDGPI